MTAVKHPRRVILPRDARSRLARGKPEVFNIDQEVLFAAAPFVGQLDSARVKVSMDGRARTLDDVLFETLRRTVKCEDMYL
jgi:putative transposase